MRALTHISAAATPDYALRVPSHVQLLLGTGLIGGLVGIGLLGVAPTLPALFGYLLLAAGVLSASFALSLSIITSPGLRERARRQMVNAVAWRGDERVLDVGCGNGFLLIETAKHLTSGSATGIDLWKTDAGLQSRDGARRNANLEGVADRVDIRNADAGAMPFEDNAFDVIVSSLMLHHAGGSADRDQVVQEMVRVLKPGGTILLYDVRPLIDVAARQLRARGLGSIEGSGRIMRLLSAKRPAASNAR